MRSNTRLLDIDHKTRNVRADDLRIRCEFMPETWTAFDRIVKWLVENGVPLAVGKWYDPDGVKLVRMRGNTPVAGGKIVANTLDQLRGSVEGEESDIDYEVFFPDDIRR
jgi:hypothetical protein